MLHKCRVVNCRHCVLSEYPISKNQVANVLTISDIRTGEHHKTCAAKQIPLQIPSHPHTISLQLLKPPRASTRFADMFTTMLSFFLSLTHLDMKFMHHKAKSPVETRNGSMAHSITVQLSFPSHERTLILTCSLPCLCLRTTED